MTFSILYRSNSPSTTRRLFSIIAVTCLACSSGNSGNDNSSGGGQASSAGGSTSSAGGSSSKASSSTTGGSNSTAGSSAAGGSASHAGGTTSKAGSGGTSPTSCDAKAIMQVSCSGPACHGSPGKPAMYYTDFFNPPAGQTVEQMLIGKPANYTLVADPSKCPTNDPELLINPDVPSESLILKKITNTQTCGVKMPNSSTQLTQQQVDCFVDWVNVATGHSGTGGSGGSGSGGRSSTGGSANDIPPTFQTVKTVLTDNLTPCVGSDCHGGHPGRLNLLVDSGLLDRLTSATSDVCSMPVVDPGQPGNSALVKVLRDGCGNVKPNCLIGTECIPKMPINCSDGVDCIPENYIQAIEQWIADGAKP